MRAHQLVLPPCDVVIKAVAEYVRNMQDMTDLEAIAKDIFKHSQVFQLHSKNAHAFVLWLANIWLLSFKFALKPFQKKYL